MLQSNNQFLIDWGFTKPLARSRVLRN